MARRKLEPMHDEHVNVTPLIDVVMCLIIFFLVVGKLVKDEMMPMVVPRAHLGQEMEDQMGRLTINVIPPAPVLDSSGTAIPRQNWGPPTVKVFGEPIITSKDGWKELTAKLRKAKGENPDLKVILRADEQETYDWIAPVLVACAQADIKNVNFSTKKPD